MASRRILLFDLAKAIAIIAVIVSHTAIRFSGIPSVGAGAPTILAACFTFHLPLFFIVSGYFLHTNSRVDLKKEIRQLIPPYVITCIFVVIGMVFVNMLSGHVLSNRTLIFEWTNAALFGAGDLVPNPLWSQSVRIGAIWFILALFWSRIVVSLAYRTRFSVLVILFSFALGMITSKLVFLPLSVQPGMTAALFVYIGTLFRRYGFFSDEEKRSDGRNIINDCLSIIMQLICLGVWIYSIINYSGFSMATNGYGISPVDILRNIAGGICSSIVVLTACKYLQDHCDNEAPWVNELAHIGRMTLVILCVHLFEDNVLPWQMVVAEFGKVFAAPGAWIIVAIIRSIVDLGVSGAIVNVTLFVRQKRE